MNEVKMKVLFKINIQKYDFKVIQLIVILIKIKRIQIILLRVLLFKFTFLVITFYLLTLLSIEFQIIICLIKFDDLMI